MFTKIISLVPAFTGILLCLLLCLVLFTGCGGSADFSGTWYEQDEDPGTITISGNSMTYTHPRFTSKTGFKTQTSGGKIEIIPNDEYWYYVDIFYDPAEDVLTMHTMPHTDGDGGYHLVEFRRTEYTAPPPPAYGERTDRSDAGAKKTFASYEVKHLTMEITEPIRDSGDMAPEPPANGTYSYELIVDGDGTGSLSSDFCRAVPVSREQLAELSRLLEGGTIPSMNGLDAWTGEMPEYTPSVDLLIEFSSGETLTARANASDLPPSWDSDGRALHKFLFGIFVDAGYNYSTGEFHSTLPMLRIGRTGDPGFTISYRTKRINQNGNAYEYLVYGEYPVFSAEGGAPEALMGTLKGLSDTWKENVKGFIRQDDGLMAEVPKSVWKKEEHRTSYSFYSPFRDTLDGAMYRFWVSEGHMNCFGLGPYGYGHYPHWRFCIDIETGKCMTVSDFFTDREALTDLLIRKLCDNYYQSHEDFYRSAEGQSMLHSGITAPEHEGGIGVDPQENGLMLFFPQEEGPWKEHFPYQMMLYYDETQEMLNEKYAEVR